MSRSWETIPKLVRAGLSGFSPNTPLSQWIDKLGFTAPKLAYSSCRATKAASSGRLRLSDLSRYRADPTATHPGSASHRRESPWSRRNSAMLIGRIELPCQWIHASEKFRWEVRKIAWHPRASRACCSSFCGAPSQSSVRLLLIRRFSGLSRRRRTFNFEKSARPVRDTI